MRRNILFKVGGIFEIILGVMDIFKAFFAILISLVFVIEMSSIAAMDDCARTVAPTQSGPDSVEIGLGLFFVLLCVFMAIVFAALKIVLGIKGTRGKWPIACTVFGWIFAGFSIINMFTAIIVSPLAISDSPGLFMLIFLGIFAEMFKAAAHIIFACGARRQISNFKKEVMDEIKKEEQSPTHIPEVTELSKCEQCPFYRQNNYCEPEQTIEEQEEPESQLDLQKDQDQ